MRNDGPKHQDDRTPALLLVENDDGLRRFLFWVLYSQGYKVLTARDGVDARRLSRDVPGPIEVLLVGALPDDADREPLRAQLESERPELQTLDIMHASPLATPWRPNGAVGASLPSDTEAGAIIEQIKAMLGNRPRRN